MLGGDDVPATPGTCAPCRRDNDRGKMLVAGRQGGVLTTAATRLGRTVVWLPLVGAAVLVVPRAAIPGADLVEALVVGILVLGTALSGSLVASRQPTNRCGRLLTSAALFLAAGTATVSYAKASVDEDRDWPFTEAVAWLAS